MTTTTMPTRRPDTTWTRCPRCFRPVRPGNLVKGFGRDCAEFLGLVGATTDTGHDGPDLLYILATIHPTGDETAR